MEILKQPQYQPIPVYNQVMIIYAVINNYIDDIKVEFIKEFERSLYDFMDTHYPQVGKSIVDEGVLSEEAEAQLKEGIELCKKEFLSVNADAGKVLA